MKIRALHILAYAAVMSFTLSCERMKTDSLTPINFSVAEYSAEVKGQSGDSDLSGFGVYAVVRNPADATPALLISNDEVTNKGKYWGTENTYYWPNRAGSTMDFYAYSPYSEQSSDAGLTLSYDSSTGKPKFTFEMSDKADVDLMVAKAEGSTAEDGTTVSLVFSHLLCKVNFAFVVSNKDGYSYVVNSIKVKNTPSHSMFEWEDELVVNTDDTKDVSKEGEGNYLIDSTDPIAIEGFTMFLMPGILGNVEVTINNDAPKILDMSSIEISANSQLTVIFEVGLSDMKFTTSVTEWITGGTTTGDIS